MLSKDVAALAATKQGPIVHLMSSHWDFATLADQLGGVIERALGWLERQRIPQCFVIGGCYLVLTHAGVGSQVTGSFWLLVYYVYMTVCAGQQGWSLYYLQTATVSRDAPA